jgi:hypothetical protein
MKKIFTFLFLLGLAEPIFCQAPTTNGTLTGNETWTSAMSPIHVTGDVTVPSGITLTINSGVRVQFDSGKSLVIVGALKANGAAGGGNQVTFTASGTSWGHIYFNNSTSASNLTYCLIEKGDATGLSPQYGGGVLAATSNLTISHSEFRNNTAGWGGAILLYPYSNTTISNSIFRNNTTLHEGAGIYFFIVTKAVVVNCIFESNNASGTGGGMFIGGDASSVEIVNSTIVKNNAVTGANVLLAYNNNATRPFFDNCIIWGSDNSVYYHQQSPQPGDFVNCAIQGTIIPGSSTFSISLNAANSNALGPNFRDPNNSDWSILSASPCVDTGDGTDPNVPAQDFNNMNRVGQVDIGAYEAQSYKWQGSDKSSPTDWNTPGNWNANAVPSGNEDIFIPSNLVNYPIDNSSLNYTISATRSLTLAPGAKATLGTLTNNGTLKLNSSSDGTASLILNSYSKGGSGSEEIQLFLTGGGTKTPLTYKWHYISSPVTSLGVSTFSPSVTLDLAQWVESRPATSLTQGWVAYDGYIYSTGGMGGPTFSNLTPGKGYDYYKNSDYTFTFGGLLNTSDVGVNLSYTAGNNDLYGLNLIGNPFTSGLDWDYIIANSFPTNTTKSLYFTRNSTLCSYINGVGVPGDVNGIIPPMQGFFSRTTSAGNTIVLAAAARTHNNIHSTYKGSGIIPLIRLSLLDGTMSDETVVRFDVLAKSYLDNDFDAVKMFLDPDLTSIYTSMSGINYAINGLPFPETLVEIPVTVNIAGESGTKSISAVQLQGLENYSVTLTDNITGFVANLKNSSNLLFLGDKGNIAGRFILKVGTIATGIEDPSLTPGKFNIYSSKNYINIQTLADEWEGKRGSVKVMDLMGRLKSDSRNTEFHKNSLVQIEAPSVQGIYIVEINSGMMRYSGKVVVR